MTQPAYTLWIPRWHPVRKNVYYECHWASRKRMRKDMAQHLWYARREADIPMQTCKRRLQITVVLGKGQRGGDPDGYVSPLLDAMQDARLLRDDGDKWVETLPVRINRDHRDNPGTVIEIWDL